MHWVELRPDDLQRRLAERSVAYLPMGLCEPHGHVAALGLDLLKAEWLCARAAERAGGVVAPSQAYHIHETGFHARWLHDVVGDTTGGLLAFPPHVVCLNLLYQLRALANAGVRAVVVVTGHVGGSEGDITRWAERFERETGLRVLVTDDVSLSGRPGDHAGRYEISVLSYIRPDLVDLTLVERHREPDSGGRLALGDTAADASAEYGREIMEAALDEMVRLVEQLPPTAVAIGTVDHACVESIYAGALEGFDEWVSARPRPRQEPVPAASRWAGGEYARRPDVGAQADRPARGGTR